MERIQVLIEKLQQQYQRKEDAGSMLVTLQLLQNELLAAQKGNKVLGTSKVAVVMPNTSPLNTSVAQTEYKQEESKPIVTEVRAEPVNRPVETFQNGYVPKIKENGQEQLPVPNAPLFDAYADAVVEAPTLAQHQTQKEINEIIAGQKESLNDRLKQEKKEVAHILKDSPVKDLRKAIGVNDKFVFISELFRGDEAMYERSIKTINTFHILPEAEYWINRELKVKLGWNDLNDTVQHFYQLVRRRFS
jgi:hypothetical protein